MENIHSLQYKNQSREELLSGLSPDFPYVFSRAELDHYVGGGAPWHWHKEVELFYIESGALEYYLPKGKITFPKGSGGLVNSDVLHMTKSQAGVKNTVQYLHIFDTALIGGQQGGRIEKKYITPFVTAPQLEILPLFPGIPEQADVLGAIRESFHLSQGEYAYEIKLREALSKIWCRLFELAGPLLKERRNLDKTSDKLKTMMIYIHEHDAEKLSVAGIASAAFISERECFRVFHDYLHLTPVEYLRSYRLQKACRLLVESAQSATDIGQACGLGSNSYFGEVFRRHIGCTPLEYRKNGGIVTSIRQI